MARSDLGLNGNLPPESWSKEKSSKAGNLVETSSRRADCRAEGGPVSSAVKGSPVAPLNGEGFALGVLLPPSALLGLPRRMGVMSGIVCSSKNRGALKAPATGGVATFGSDEGRC